MQSAYDYMKEINGINSELFYPYTASEGTCKYSSSRIVSRITGYNFIPSGDENALTTALATIGKYDGST